MTRVTLSHIHIDDYFSINFYKMKIRTGSQEKFRFYIMFSIVL